MTNSKKTNYVYHRVPENMTGNILYPLNNFKQKNIEIYNKEVEKYSGRERLLKLKIPILDCLWNDVLHLSPVDPSEIWHFFRSLNWGKKQQKFYKIPVDLLDKEKIVIYLYKHKDGEKMIQDFNFVKFDENILEENSKLPNKAKEYYKKSIANNEKFLLFHRVPHVLYKGEINISDLEIIEV
ncbi:hypothetical protein ACFL0K_01860 [Patescibacteria group bacterium]